MKSGYLVSETPELRKLWNSTLGCVTHRKMNTDPSDISCVDSIPAQMNRQQAPKSWIYISLCHHLNCFLKKVSSSERSIIWGHEQRRENITSKCLRHEFIVFPRLMLWEHWGNQHCILLRRKGCIFFFRGGVSSLFDKESLVDVSELCEEQFIKNQKSSSSQKEDCSKQTPLEWQNCYEHITH